MGCSKRDGMRYAVVFSLLSLSSVLCFAQPPAHPTASPATDRLPSVGKPAPDFIKSDVFGKKCRLADFQGRPAVLFFFCGCSWCREVAEEWATLQQTQALPLFPVKGGDRLPGKQSEPIPPATLLVYQGTPPEIKALAATTHLDLKQTILLSDADRKIADALYHADPCPRVLVLDAQGIVRYINRGPDDKPREAPASLIIARTLTTLRNLSLAQK